MLLLTAAEANAVALQQTSAVTPAVADSPEAHLGKGYDALKHDRYDVAASEFRAALQLDPTLVTRARFPLAVALFELKEPVEARKELESVRREIGDHPNVLYYLGRLDLMEQNFTGAIRNLSKAVAQPPFPDTAYYLGVACFKQGDLPAAEKWLKLAAQVSPQDSLVQYQLAQVYRREGREQEANNAAALSAQLRRRDADESKLKVECAQKLDEGPRSEAHAVCDRLYDPDNAEKLTALGTIYGQHGDLEAALGPLRRAAELAPQSPQMQYNLAFTYYQLNRYAEARAPIAQAVERWPDIFQLNALYGAILSKLGDDLLAYQALRRAHQLNPQDSGTGETLYITTLALARKCQAGRQYSDSLRYFNEAANLRPDDPEPHKGMAEIYALTGHPAEAAAELQKADHLNSGLGIR
ncbi:MAG: tetratricopeptide repeat protein [Acidobacteriaceae bacterium]|nr:tetratricopeptide repeat protein [Acidobacteriaceae bacterium]